MGSRRVYRGIEEAALLGGFENSSYPHSYIARGLRYAYRELRDVARSMDNRAISTASLYGNSRLDTDRGASFVDELLSSSISTIKYMSTKKENKKSDVDRAIAMYNKLNSVISKEEIRREYVRIAGEKEKEHVLGGDRPTRQLKRIAK